MMQTRCNVLKQYRFAHRGFHDKPTIPENSMAAFKRAKERGWGAELDIHLMKDGNLAVIHDASLKRTTGADVFIEDLTAEDLEKYSLEESSERIPLFEEVLALGLPLIVELKVERGNYNELSQKAYEMLKDYKAPWCMESFDPRAVAWFMKNAPEVVRGQLSQDFYRDAEVKLPGYQKLLLTKLLTNFMNKPDFIAYNYIDREEKALRRSIKKGIQEVSWTVRDKETMEKLEKDGCICIFEKFDPDK